MPTRTAIAGSSSPSRILVVDDEPLIRANLAEFLGQEGFTVETAADAETALARAADTHFDLAICDIQLPGLDGVELLGRLLKLSPDTFVLLITAYGTVETAVEAFKRGAHDYLLKPLIFDEVLAKIQQFLRYRELHLENQWLRRELHREQGFQEIVGKSSAMQRVLATTAKVARTRTTVLLVGESGTGKELIARAIHQLGEEDAETRRHGDAGKEDAGTRRHGDAERESRVLSPRLRVPASARPPLSSSPVFPFIPINCAAIPNDLLENQLFGHRKGAYTGADRDQEGVFERAGAGTVFLDEVGELSPAVQAKLLRAIEQKEVFPVGAAEPLHVEARIIAATNKDLAKAVEEKRFREDLYYRLNIVSITLPPLRERREDIPDLVDFLLTRHVRSLGKRIAGVDHEAMKLLMSAPWRGNIRELDNALQRAVILGEGPLVTPADLPPGLAPSPDVCLSDDLREAVAHFERRHLERILRETPDKKEAAKRLGLALSSLYRKIEELGMKGAGE